MKVNVWILDDKNHIEINRKYCIKCQDKPCIRLCPGKCFYEAESQVMHSYDSCLECGVCRVVCPFKAISWSYPRGGYGVWYRFG